MAEESKAGGPAKYDLNAKWDACLDLGVRRFVYSSFAGAVSALLLFRNYSSNSSFSFLLLLNSVSPVTRWASVAFGAGVGIGSAYSECSYKFDRSSPILAPNISDAPLSKIGYRAYIYLGWVMAS
ncbi:hypothetical protein Sango_1192700 [Sesamum angolense]|uniref:Uncharacterized protein n=1 Tax=Sesamum angolense TaxID=2727404 RepID=A0AAE2BWZ6_9LAMI|nr:hypothetical protein Sango_1192700 [Sesamum angolense]